MPTPSTPTPHLQRARAAFERRGWQEAWEAFGRAAEDGQLAPEDLWRLAVSAYLIGRADGYVEALDRAHRLQREEGDAAGAARSAFWIGFHLANAGEAAQASGWFGRAARLLESAGGDHVERGYLLIPAAHQRFIAGDHDEAARIAAEATAVAEAFGDRDLLALALHLQGRVLLGQGRIEDGLALLDEAMVAVATDELTPPVTGLIYCSVIGACRGVYALARAREWTAALSDWCERQPDMVAYRGECRVYRSELLQLRGAWRDAIAEASRAAERLPDEADPATALAHYQCGEGHRLLGEWDAAEEAYRAASRAGREPQPGLALLRLARGETEAAAAAIRRAVAETTDPLRRVRLLPAQVEILIAVGDTAGARRACDELTATADAVGSPALDALSAHARGAVALAEDDARGALPYLRRACEAWHALDAPYDAARARVLIAAACRELGDDDGAALELEAAREAFRRLGAADDAARADAAAGSPARGGGRTHGLTPREREVLTHVATGKTNQAIADALFISDRTVARHVSNIFAKLGLSSRAAATAFAYEHDLVDPSAQN